MTHAASRHRAPAILLIGGSAGAVEGVLRLVAALPEATPWATVVVLHMPRDAESRPAGGLADVLRYRARVPVEDLLDKQALIAPTVFVAPPGYHCLIDEGPSASLSVDEPVNYSQPSIDVLFESAADVVAAHAVAVLLSGANADGARGVAAIVEAGGRALIQSPKECPNPEMPEAALELCPDAVALPMDEIARTLRELALKAAGPLAHKSVRDFVSGHEVSEGAALDDALSSCSLQSRQRGGHGTET